MQTSVWQVIAKHRAFLCFLGGVVLLYVLIPVLLEAASLPVLSQGSLTGGLKDAKEWLLSWGWGAPVAFVFLHITQVILAPIPGQAAGVVGGYVFGWARGVTYTMLGLTLGSALVIYLSRRFGRRFVLALNPGETVRDFERVLLGEESKVATLCRTSYRSAAQNAWLTFFLVMLLPGLPDDVACFVAGLSRIRFGHLLLAVVLGRFPGMLVLSLVGEGLSRAEASLFLFCFITLCSAVTLLYLWKKNDVERVVLRCFCSR